MQCIHMRKRVFSMCPCSTRVEMVREFRVKNREGKMCSSSQNPCKATKNTVGKKHQKFKKNCKLGTL